MVSTDPVSLLMGIVSALVGAAIVLPIFVRLARERSFIRQRDAAWEEATDVQQEQLRAIYAIRGDVESLLEELNGADFQLAESYLQFYDELIDESWRLRAQGGLEVGVEEARRIMRDAGEWTSAAEVVEHQATVVESVERVRRAASDKKEESPQP